MSRIHGGLMFSVLYFYLLFTIASSNRVLSRRKRYVVFPEGSSFSIALCLTMKTLSSDPNIFTEGVNWGISYDLPNETKPEFKSHLQLLNDRINPIPGEYDYQVELDHHIRNKDIGKYNDWKKENKKFYHNIDDSKKYYYRQSNHNFIQRRYRRDLYNKLEVIMNAMGFNGRSCILRALCEASQRLRPKGNSLVREMMRIAFSLPLKGGLLSHEPKEHHTYTEAHRSGKIGARCEVIFADCPFSLIDMALGKYNIESGNESPDIQDSDVSSNVDQDLIKGSFSHLTMK